MHIRTFRAASLQDALAEIRQQMGPEAAVLHTRQVRDGVLGWLGKTHVEVTAGLRDETDRKRGALAFEPSHSSSAKHQPSTPAVPSERLSVSLTAGSRAASVTAALRDRLSEAGVPAKVAARWLEQAEQSAHTALGFPAATLSTELVEEHLRRRLTDQWPCGGPVRAPAGQRRVVALVGPTGVGKTTTIAKLAAGFRIQQKRRVGLLTIDTYRIAAVQQLQAYAEIMDLPMRVVESPQQMQEGLEELGDVELVLIDTAGRSPRGVARINQLKTLLAAAAPHETHLVMSATASAESIRSTLQGFAPVVPTATILTKLDETEQLAGVLAALETAAPLSYLTNGQQVPDDIETASSGSVLDRFLAAPAESAQRAA